MLRKYYKRPAQLQEVITNVLDEPLNSVYSAVISIPDGTLQEHDLPNTIIFPTLAQKESSKTSRFPTISQNWTRIRFLKILNDFSEVFSDILGKTTIYQHKITLTSDIPIRCKLCPIPLHYRTVYRRKFSNKFNYRS